MLEKLKNTLVESFVGVIALGWLFAQGIMHFAYVFTAPLAGWISSREYFAMTARTTSPGYWFRDSLLELARSFSLLLLGYVLLRWLYFGHRAKKKLESTPGQTEGIRTADSA
jgi:hypothetical protein